MSAPTVRSLLGACLASTVTWLASASASACAVCGGGDSPEASKIAFIVTTALLTFLPLGMLGAVFYWIRRRVRELEGGPRFPALAETPRTGSPGTPE